jgi:hypothetical protein
VLSTEIIGLPVFSATQNMPFLAERQSCGSVAN